MCSAQYMARPIGGHLTHLVVRTTILWYPKEGKKVRIGVLHLVISTTCPLVPPRSR